MKPLVGMLLEQGLPILADSVLEQIEDKGIDSANKFIKDKTGIELDLNTIDKDSLKIVKELLGTHSDTFNSVEKELQFEKEVNREEPSIVKAGIKEQALFLHDVQDAREKGHKMMESEDKLMRYFLPSFSVFLVIVILGFMGAVIWIPSTADGMKGIESSVLEFFKSILILLIGFWFGSSHSSSNKDKMLNEHISKK